MTTSAELAYEHVKSKILSGEYGGGTRMPEDTIAGALGVSRTPVRDALRRLESEGLIESAPNSGARVARWTEVELTEIANMRILLESYAAELAARKIRPDQIKALIVQCDIMQAASEGEPDIATVSSSNLSFHRLVAQASGNSRLVASLEPLWHLPMVLRKYSLFSTERLARSVQHHREITTALEANDPNWAQSIMHAHLSSARVYDRLITDQNIEVKDAL
jgi:DNA-binding GntR family transcriptional regulator